MPNQYQFVNIVNGHEYLLYGFDANFENIPMFVMVKTYCLSLMDDEYCFKTIYEKENHNDIYEITQSSWVCYKVY